VLGTRIIIRAHHLYAHIQSQTETGTCVSGPRVPECACTLHLHLSLSSCVFFIDPHVLRLIRPYCDDFSLFDKKVLSSEVDQLTIRRTHITRVDRRQTTGHKRIRRTRLGQTSHTPLADGGRHDTNKPIPRV
jgi:hypothetical protein